ncbi:hypothetical protein ACH5RR_003500 [Cinchona calisaya]|uniref:Uncharacterized protein n=1 Tax=Cinchona calisaya TaxID=153742 RepID=A0ABD3AVL5_9GENT
MLNIVRTRLNFSAAGICPNKNFSDAIHHPKGQVESKDSEVFTMDAQYHPKEILSNTPDCLKIDQHLDSIKPSEYTALSKDLTQQPTNFGRRSRCNLGRPNVDFNLHVIINRSLD